jgi:hypothetical protein
MRPCPTGCLPGRPNKTVGNRGKGSRSHQTSGRRYDLRSFAFVFFGTNQSGVLLLRDRRPARIERNHNRQPSLYAGAPPPRQMPRVELCPVCRRQRCRRLKPLAQPSTAADWVSVPIGPTAIAALAIERLAAATAVSVMSWRMAANLGGSLLERRQATNLTHDRNTCPGPLSGFVTEIRLRPPARAFCGQSRVGAGAHRPEARGV